MVIASLRVCSFESRRQDEMAALIRRHGGIPTVAPSMQEVPLDDNDLVFEFSARLLAHEFDAVLFLTGVGARTLVEIAERRFDRLSLLAALQSLTILVRGPKPAAVMRDWDIPITIAAPEPNTWKEVIAAIDSSDYSLRNCRIAVQEYGQPSDALYASLQERGANVTPVPIYKWALPDETAPLEQAVRTAAETGFDLYLFTSAQQIKHALLIARQLGLEDAWRLALAGSVVASIGPTCSDALREAGLPVDLEPTHPKMGTLVREAMTAVRDGRFTQRSL